MHIAFFCFLSVEEVMNLGLLPTVLSYSSLGVFMQNAKTFLIHLNAAVLACIALKL
jgi:hypothetical protein